MPWGLSSIGLLTKKPRSAWQSLESQLERSHSTGNLSVCPSVCPSVCLSVYLLGSGLPEEPSLKGSYSGRQVKSFLLPGSCFPRPWTWPQPPLLLGAVPTPEQIVMKHCAGFVNIWTRRRLNSGLDQAKSVKRLQKAYLQCQ